MNCEIRHSIVIAAAPEVVCAALSEPRQLARWWTREVSLADDLVRLDWSRQGWRVELSIDEGADHQLVCWRCHDSNMLDTDAWKGTVMRFELRSISQGTQVDFVQSGYRDSPCKEACTRGWRFFLGSSLKRYVETGEGAPSADMRMPVLPEHNPCTAR
ncbi:SRPBCC family protein [Xanthomonas euvesicatoria]|uniref:SRPBCC family protein n=1 Tax=Xanthomonas euvesicatoria TaxID=456327 RepID=UPI001C47174B|nr:SRPBCC domain-containing protein [Xanthomonas euvesicatoria]MBV6885629.1 SRPBCC domain-containing protein [Xanthomonas campestris pv. euphorbiae]